MADTNLSKWLVQRHEHLREKFGDKRFTLQDAADALSAKFKDQSRNTNAILSSLRKAGLLETAADPADARRKSYIVRPAPQGENGITKKLFVEPTHLTRSDIEGVLKKAADLIRTRVDYKFILILLFLKRISDKWELEYEAALKEALEDGLDRKQAEKEAKSAAYHDFDIPEEFLWESLRRDVAALPEKFSRALKGLAERNPELKDILDSADFVQFTTNRENAEILRQLVELFSEKKLHHVSADILGDAYEWILRYFAPQKAKEGEVYTPREVIRLLVEILEPKPGEHVYDPACGSAGMLIMASKYVEEKHGKEAARKLFLYGQEANQKTLALARMNMYIHDTRDVSLMSGDTLLYPKFKDGEGVRRFHVVIANPPWNLDGFDEEVLKKSDFWKKRFSFGFPPRQSADWAWIQHMLASAQNEEGRVGVLIDNGCLFRSGKEGGIREQVVKADLLDAVILLPEKLFYNTPAPGALLILSKAKSKARKGKVLFVDASLQFEKHPEMKKLNRLGQANIQAIRGAYYAHKDKAGFAQGVEIEQIARNDFNLSVSRYVESGKKEEKVDAAEAWERTQSLNTERERIRLDLTRVLADVKSWAAVSRGPLGPTYWNSEIGMIPATWKVARISEVTEISGGSTPSTRNERFWNGGIPFVTPSDITNLSGLRLRRTENSITQEGLQSISASLLPPGSVLVTSRASIGLVAINDVPVVTNQGFANFVCGPELHNEFLAYLMMLLRPTLERLGSGSTFKEVSRATMRKLPIPIPPLSEQKDIAKVLCAVDADIHKTYEIATESERLKRGLMQTLLMGRAQIKR